MIRKIASLTVGNFIPAVITATGLKKDTRGAENTFKKVRKWRREEE